MSATYSFRLSDAYIIEAHERHRARNISRWLRWPMKTISAVGLLALLLIGAYIGEVVVIAVSALFLTLLLLGPRIDYFILRRRWRRVPQFNEELRLEVSDKHLLSSSPKSSGTTQWSAYMRAVQHADGVLMYSTPWQYFWLPDRAIVAGTPEQTRSIVRTHIRDYVVV